LYQAFHYASDTCFPFHMMQIYIQSQQSLRKKPLINKVAEGPPIGVKLKWWSWLEGYTLGVWKDWLTT
jgi:hypothetical protein